MLVFKSEKMPAGRIHYMLYCGLQGEQNISGRQVTWLILTIFCIT